MSDEGERTCPLCAEEMDLTDQQLKPCKCGYEICVWCWHHIMDMAEKDDTEGRCPACRSAYDREKIVGMASNCERLVAEVTMEKKIKSQKAKAKSSEGRKQLSSVRVIQRNLVYIVGLPLNVADEDLLERREYFGQYGKVLKVSMSRTATGLIQQFPNNTCSVYITYSKEEEAIRCIQNVHQFVWEGKSLRACFGTTKYCHAWLRNMPCTNPDCLYLHEIGSQEDSFTKDEIISAYTRVQQITGTSNSLQRRSGNMLPPPVDDYCTYSSASTGKPTIKSASNSAGSIVRGSPPNGSTGKSMALPAAASWGTRGSSCLPPAMTCSTVNAPSKAKADTVSNTLPFSGASAASTFHAETGKKPIISESKTPITKIKPDTIKSVTSQNGSYPSERLDEPEGPTSETLSCQLSGLQELKDHHKDKGSSPYTTSVDFTGKSQESNLISDVHINKLCSDISSMATDGDAEGENAVSVSDKDSSKAPENHQGFHEYISEQFREPLLSAADGLSSIHVAVSREECDWTSKTSRIEEDVESFSSQRHNDPELVSHSNYLPAITASLNGLNQVGSRYSGSSEAYRSSIGVKDDYISLDKKFNDSTLLSSNIPVTANVYSESFLSSSAGSDDYLVLPNEGRRHIGRYTGNVTGTVGNYSDKGESSIISNILSMDCDVWNDSLASPQNLAKFLGETEKQSSSVMASSPWRVQNNSQSRFSFARQEEYRSQDLTHSPLNVTGQLQKSHSVGLGISEHDHAYADKFRLNNGSYLTNYEGFENLSGNTVTSSFNNFSAPPRAQISAPPGFSVPNKAPPPGFSSHERLNHASDSTAGNHLHDTSSLLRNIYQGSQAGNNVNASELEFMDPAILAVGKGRIQLGLNNPGLDMRSNFTSQSSAFESDPRVQLLMQRSLSPQQNLRFSDVMDGFNHVSDSYGFSSRLLDQCPVKNLSPYAQMSIQHPRNNGVMSNSHWDSWSDAQNGNNMGMAELLRNDRVGFNKFYNGYEDSKFRMPSSGDLYNRTFGM